MTVNTNRTRLPNGQLTGPVIVSIFGIPVYVGQHTGPPKSLAQKQGTAQQVELSNITKQAKHHGSSKTTSKPEMIKSQDTQEGQTKMKLPLARMEDANDQKSEEDSVVELTASKNKDNLNAILIKLTEKISQQNEAIKQLKMEKNQLQARSMMINRVSPAITSNIETQPKAKLEFEQVAEMMRNRRHQI